MTTQRDRGTDYGTLPTAIPYVLEQWTRRLYTAMPGEVIAYDRATRRADVRGSLDVVTSDGQNMPRPVITDVPVVLPASQLFVLDFELKPQDQVLLVFGMRGLSRWLIGHSQAPADVDGMMSEKDAIAIPGFGPLGAHQPAQRIYADDDGIEVHGGNVRIEGATQVTIVGGSVTLTGTTTINGVSVADSTAGTGSAGTPAHTHTLTGA